MIVAHAVWLLIPLVAAALDATANATSAAECIISLVDPYRNIRPVCLADLNPVSCERIPVPPQTILERSCIMSDDQGNSSCLASAIAKSEATLEERLKDLKESLAQDGVIPDDFMTFEAWKAGQLHAMQKVEEKKPAEPGLKSRHTMPDREIDSAAGSFVPDTSSNVSTEKAEEQKSARDKPPRSVDAGASKKVATSQKTPPLAPHRYNYASPDCSARVHSASPQSQHASSVLHKSKDRYMLTPCSAKEHWVIIELCDDIRVEAVEIGMFEFFSGIVKEVRVSIGGADDEDADEEDKSAWQEVGSFIGRNSRGTQLFTLNHPTSFQRFIRLDFPSHYGNEYYCPISSIKVYGMNQMEAFKWESRKQKELEGVRKRLEADHQHAQQTVTKVATILASRTESVSVASTTGLVSSSHSLQNTSSDQPLQRTKTIDSGFRASSTNASLTPEMRANTTVTQAGKDGGNTGVPSPTRSRPSVRSSGTSISLDQTTFQHSRAVETASVASVFAPLDVTPSPLKQMWFSSSAVDSSTSTLRPVNTRPNMSASEPSSSIQRNIPSPAGAFRPEARVDHSESIYAYIIRRLNALEGNSTLGMMYMEEQTKATRGILQKLENHLADWKIQVENSHKAAIQHERTAWERSLDNLIHRMEQRDTLLERETRSLRSHIRQLREQISWAQRRNYLHIAVTTFMVLVFFLNRKPGQPYPQSRLDLELETLSTSSDERRHAEDDAHAFAPLADSRSSSPYAFYPRLSAKNRVPSYSKIHSRRPSTAIVQKYRSKAPPSSTQRNVFNQHGLELKSFNEVRLSSSLSSAPRVAGPRRLARSAHLHTLSNAGRFYQNKSDSTSVEATGASERHSPTKSRLRLESHIGGTADSKTQHLATKVGTVSTLPVASEASERASASEAEEDMDSASE